MHDELPPALTREEWRDAGAVVRMEAGKMFGETHPASVHVGVGAERLYFHPTSAAPSDSPTPVVLMALGNHALPAESPYKITRDDVHAVRDAVSVYARLRSALSNIDDAELQNGVRSIVRDDLDRLAAKLAALLPPE